MANRSPKHRVPRRDDAEISGPAGPGNSRSISRGEPLARPRRRNEDVRPSGESTREKTGLGGGRKRRKRG